MITTSRNLRGTLVLLLLALTFSPAARPALAQEASPPPSPPAAEQAEEHRVDINGADLVELMGLPRVGPVLAARIVEHRRAVAPFRSVDELLLVKGIGLRTLERLRPHVRVEDPGAPAAPTAEPEPAPTEEPATP
ncbi:MAG: helix-hairpin-helix domain-containing protein [Acidobacteriota bacterium]